VNLFDLVQALIDDTLSSMAGFRGELVLCATIVLMLLLRIPTLTSRIDSFYVMLTGSAAALYLAGPWNAIVQPSELFTGLLINDPFTVYFRTLLLLFAVLFAIFTRISGVPDRDAAPDIYSLVLGSTLGMCLMASANHLLIIFLAVEMASVPSYALAGLLKGRRASSEAALKYAVYGAGAAGVMLYGISLLAGVLGSVQLPTMAARLAALLQAANVDHTTGTDTYMVLVLGGLMILVGIAFKLSAVPFHFWCPDVFEGASAEVNAFLSVASKAAALALLVRVAVGFGYITPPPVPQPEEVALFNVAESESASDAVADHDAALLSDSSADAASPPLDRTAQIEALAPVRGFLWRALAFLAIITCTFGNLAA
jgi:NADH-quinone oxidoreductase subunit N